MSATTEPLPASPGTNKRKLDDSPASAADQAAEKLAKTAGQPEAGDAKDTKAAEPQGARPSVHCSFCYRAQRCAKTRSPLPVTADQAQAELAKETELVKEWQQKAQDNVYSRSDDVRLTLSRTVLDAAMKALKERAGNRSRVVFPDVAKVKQYMGCGAEVQNYDRASFTVKVNMHRDGADLTLPLEAIGKNEDVAPWLCKLQLDDVPEPVAAAPTPAAATMPPGAMGSMVGMPGMAYPGMMPQMMQGYPMAGMAFPGYGYAQPQAYGYPQQAYGYPQQPGYGYPGYPQQQPAYQQPAAAAAAVPGAAAAATPAAGAAAAAAPPPASAAAAAGLPAGWSSAIDPASGRTYYINSAAGNATTWEKPAS